MRLKSKIVQFDFFSPALGSSESSGILEQILMDQAHQSPQIVVTNWYIGQNSRNFLMSGKETITMC